MEKWTQGWLAYTPKADMGNGRLVQKTAIADFDKSNEVIANAVGELFYPQLGVKLCSMAGGGVQKIYMVFLREPSR